MWDKIVAWWWKPRFFPSKYRPRIVALYHVGFARLTVWGPYPFVSLAIGRLYASDQLVPHGHKVRGFQVYLGIKCPGGDNTRRFPGYYAMEYTIKELGAFRYHYVALQPELNDMAGA